MPLCSVTTGASGSTGASFASATDASTSSAYKFVGRDVGELISNKCVTSLLLGDRGYSYDGRSGVEKVFGLPVGCRVYVTVGVKEEGNATGVHTAHGCFKEAVKGEYFKSMYKGTDGRVEDSVRQIVNGQKGTDGRQGTNADVFSGRYPFVVASMRSEHRDVFQHTQRCDPGSLEGDVDGVFSSPDVVEVRRGEKVVYFRSASVFDLMGTARARLLRERVANGGSHSGSVAEKVEEWCPGEFFGKEVGTLFCCTLAPGREEGVEGVGFKDVEDVGPSEGEKGERKDPMVGCRLNPLSDFVVDALLDVYAVSKVEKGLSSCLEALPDKTVGGGEEEEVSTPSTPAWEMTADEGAGESLVGGGESCLDDAKYEHEYCVVYNPSPPAHEFTEYYDYDEDGAIKGTFPAVGWDGCAAMLVQYKKGRGGVRGEEAINVNVGERGGAKKVKKKWDNAILSNYCRWRACTCEATAMSAPKYLCAAHSEIKVFLDWRAVGGEGSVAGGGAPPTSADSSRFLPKKVPQGKMDDLQLIKFASSLLVELENGKLSSTIETFCKRAAAESSEKYCMGLRKQAAGGEGEEGAAYSMPWARWLQSDEYGRVTARLSKDLQITKQIQNIERGVTSEVGRLRELGVYPSAELVLIRRQFKMLEQEFGGDGGDTSAEGGREEVELELEFCERKRQLLRHRRMEVEGDNVIGGGGEDGGGDGGEDGGKDKMFFNAPANVNVAVNVVNGGGPQQFVEKRMGVSRTQQMQQQARREEQQLKEGRREEQRREREEREGREGRRMQQQESSRGGGGENAGNAGKPSPYTLALRRPSMNGTTSTVGSLHASHRRSNYK